MFGIATATQANEVLEAHRAKAYKPEQAYDWALDLAKLEGTVEVFDQIEAVVAYQTEKGKTAQEVATAAMVELVSILSRGADDTWSGRGNDLKRSRFDGRCEAARNLMYKHRRTALGGDDD